MVVVVVVVYPKVRDNNWRDIPVDVPSPTKILGGDVCPASPAGLTPVTETRHASQDSISVKLMCRWPSRGNRSAVQFTTFLSAFKAHADDSHPYLTAAAAFLLSPGGRFYHHTTARGGALPRVSRSAGRNRSQYTASRLVKTTGRL